MNKIILAVSLAVLSSVALAKTPPPAQNHSCIKDGAVVEKTKKQCIKAGGKWEKNTPATVTAPATPAAATTPTPAATTPAPAVEAPTK